MATKKELTKLQYGFVDSDGETLFFKDTGDLIGYLHGSGKESNDVVVGEYELKRVGKIGIAFVETKSK